MSSAMDETTMPDLSRPFSEGRRNESPNWHGQDPERRSNKKLDKKAALLLKALRRVDRSLTVPNKFAAATTQQQKQQQKHQHRQQQHIYIVSLLIPSNSRPKHAKAPQSDQQLPVRESTNRDEPRCRNETNCDEHNARSSFVDRGILANVNV